MKLSQITASHDKWELIVICWSSIIHQGKYTIKYFRYAAPVSPVLTQTIDQQEHGMKPHPLKWSFRQSYYNELYVPRYSYKTDIIALNRWKYCFFFFKVAMTNNLWTYDYKFRLLTVFSILTSALCKICSCTKKHLYSKAKLKWKITSSP